MATANTPRFDFVVVWGIGGWDDNAFPVPDDFEDVEEWSRHDTAQAAMAERDRLEQIFPRLKLSDASAVVVVLPHRSTTRKEAARV